MDGGKAWSCQLRISGARIRAFGARFGFPLSDERHRNEECRWWNQEWIVLVDQGSLVGCLRAQTSARIKLSRFPGSRSGKGMLLR